MIKTQMGEVLSESRGHMLKPSVNKSLVPFLSPNEVHYGQHDEHYHSHFERIVFYVVLHFLLQTHVG
jgi:hypothetical protein